MLLNYESDGVLKLIKLGFAMSVVVGFPLMIYPCRQSIFTLFIASKVKYKSLNDDSTYIPNSSKFLWVRKDFRTRGSNFSSISLAYPDNSGDYHGCGCLGGECRDDFGAERCPHGHLHRIHSTGTLFLEMPPKRSIGEFSIVFLK